MLLDRKEPTLRNHFELADEAMATFLHSFADGLKVLSQRQGRCDDLVGGVLAEDIGEVGQPVIQPREINEEETVVSAKDFLNFVPYFLLNLCRRLGMGFLD